MSTASSTAVAGLRSLVLPRKVLMFLLRANLRGECMIPLVLIIVENYTTITVFTAMLPNGEFAVLDLMPT